ncbi:hypothetical protein OG689_23660 [Kitasatospora sp. NBC_00240]|uniref:hypothetical protein n=1 Tax=Kitasatospora sp. NBC_00240 TaxID=2903567 RepID=UPI00225B296B|nr:hypothetical protein [Kitasatospora sp. NBC_00240]MCX5212243.1 hypothetical protein [Kitasatospora sp. NBC_00240]
MAFKKSGAGLAVLGAAMLLGTGTAHADPVTNLQRTDVVPAVGGLTGALGYGVAPVKDLRLDPFAQSSADVLNNGVAVQPENSGLTPVATTTVTGPLSDGGGPRDLPAVGPLLGVLPG